MSENQVPVIQSDAQIQLTVGTPYIKRLQELMFYLVIDKTEDQLDAFSKELENGTGTFSEDWMTHYFTVMVFLTTVDSAAQEQGFIKNMNESDLPNPQDN